LITEQAENEQEKAKCTAVSNKHNNIFRKYQSLSNRETGREIIRIVGQEKGYYKRPGTIMIAKL